MRKICVFTGTRAEYGLLKPLLDIIKADDELTLQLIVSGTHLSPEFGLTYKNIESDGFKIDEKVEIVLSSDTPTGICTSMGLGLIGYCGAIQRILPDIIVILGDRYEAFGMATAATVCCVPVVHIHGGEQTLGAIDEVFRHSITKMAHIHFPCCEEYRQRIIQMGESLDTVHNVGSLGVENIKKMEFLDKNELEKSIDFTLDKPFFLITFHPVTLEKNNSGIQLAELLSALDEYPDHKCIFTQANADSDGRIINQMLNDYAYMNLERCIISPSLGYLRYLSAMRLCDAVIGNSSSGIIEAPALKVATINIGDRQKGRLKAESIIDCQPTKDSILGALKIIYSNSFQTNLSKMNIPYEKDGTAKNIIETIKKVKLRGLLRKRFIDI